MQDVVIWVGPNLHFVQYRLRGGTVELADASADLVVAARCAPISVLAPGLSGLPGAAGREALRNLGAALEPTALHSRLQTASLCNPSLNATN